MSRVWQFIASIIPRMRRVLARGFADDIFISYARHEALYATGLADELTRNRLACDLDRLATDPGTDLPASLVARIQNASALVVVGSEHAAVSDPVRQEIEAFVSTGRNWYLIDVAGAVGSARFATQANRTTLPEAADALPTGTPSRSVLDTIDRTFPYRRRGGRRGSLHVPHD